LKEFLVGYGVENVVGGFGEMLTPEESIPFSLNRTYHEHRQLREILIALPGLCKLHTAVELGCGYGRNLPVLQEFATIVTGVERDTELARIAYRLNPDQIVYSAPITSYASVLKHMEADLVLTFTFLQHLTDKEVEIVTKEISRITKKGSFVVLCEETNPLKSHVGCWSRTPEQYHGLLDRFSLILVRDRILEATFPGRISGKFMVFRKDGI
jgi:SAM-dependent methyltransferase